MGIDGIEHLKPTAEGVARVIKDGKRDKSLNTPEFNKKVKARRAKAKHDAKGRVSGRKKK